MSIDQQTHLGITFNGKHSSEFGITVCRGKKVGMPTKIKKTIRVPNSNQIYDLSGLYGDQEFGERVIHIPFEIVDFTEQTESALYLLWTQIVNWLMSSNGKVQLIDDVMPRFYYLAEVQKEPDFEELLHYGTLAVDFTCDPFRFDTRAEGDDDWDSFNFELDYAQCLEFEVKGERVVDLMNPGISSVELLATSQVPFTITQCLFNKERDIAVAPGEGIATGVYVAPGANTLTLKANGLIQLSFFKALI